MKQSGFNFNHTYANLPSLYFTKTNPMPVKEPQIFIFNKRLAKEMKLDPNYFKSGKGVAILAGNEITEQMLPLAQAYAGHQFGQFTMLGDGRAILLGEHKMNDQNIVDVQLKGSGRTIYSRGGDGRAPLGPMLREYLISEAMHALRIPSTRGLAVVKTGELVLRERPIPGGILTRIASSHLRVGTFQYGAGWGSKKQLKALADYAISRHDPDLSKDEDRYEKFLLRVIDRQAYLIAQWQLVGFVHGVMNTDNMTISGETIDYGPCAFIDAYEQRAVFSSIDHERRYNFGNQPFIGKWNLTRFAETLLPLLHEDSKKSVQRAEDLLATYNQTFTNYYLNGMRRKLGLFNKAPDDEQLIRNLLKIMEKYEADYTNTFLQLTFHSYAEITLSKHEDFKQWFQQWDHRRRSQNESIAESKKLMKNNNPAIIPRNYFVEKAINDVLENDDDRLYKTLHEVLRSPYDHSVEQAKFSTVPKMTVPYRTFCGT